MIIIYSVRRIPVTNQSHNSQHLLTTEPLANRRFKKPNHIQVQHIPPLLSASHAFGAISPPSRRSQVDGFHVVGGQHAALSSALAGARHPAVIDGLTADHQVTFPERDLVCIGRLVVVERPTAALPTGSTLATSVG